MESVGAELREADLRVLVGFAGDVAQCRTDADLDAQLTVLKGMVAAESAIVSECRDWGRKVRLASGDRELCGPAMVEAVARGAGDHPVLRDDLAAPQPGARRLSDFVRPREWRRRGLFNDFYRPLGLTEELSAQLAWGPSGSSCCLTLHRGGRDFSERERLLLAQAAPHLRSTHERLALGEDRREPNPARLARLLPITARQAEVLDLLAAGRTNDGIAQELRISPHTVVRHVENLYARLGVHTRVAATRAALAALSRSGSS